MRMQEETAGLERAALTTAIDMRVLSEPSSTSNASSSSLGHGHRREGGGRSSKPRMKGARGRGAGEQVFRSVSALPEYFARALDYRQMDLDATFYQMVTLCVQPSKVYKSAYYRKQTKNRWARDDPAFAAIQFLFLLVGVDADGLPWEVQSCSRVCALMTMATQVATIAWAVAFHGASFASIASLLFHAVIVEWLAFGLVISTLCWYGELMNAVVERRADLVSRLIGAGGSPTTTFAFAAGTSS